MKLALLADIHANLTALETVLAYCDAKYGPIKLCLLGDYVDYGMRPNETLNRLASLKGRIMVNLLGNHEDALLDTTKAVRFSSDRGRAASKYTADIIAAKWLDYFRNELSCGSQSLEVDGLRILCVHGDLTDVFWGKMADAERGGNEAYRQYDVVISGHTHIPLLNYVATGKNHSTLFINPGSVGQPRNLNPNTQFAVLDTVDKSVVFESLSYDINAEYKLYDGSIDSYYAERLLTGH